LIVIQVWNSSLLYPELEPDAWTVNPANRAWADDADGIPGCISLLVGIFGVVMGPGDHTAVGKGIGARSKTLSGAGAAKALRPRARITVISVNVMISKRLVYLTV
jgi:hypothetical protein